jgi:alpha-tubulin suppressor-like RCC1 family protein
MRAADMFAFSRGTLLRAAQRLSSLGLLVLVLAGAHSAAALTVTVTGTGQIVSVPAGIQCGNGATSCTANFPAGTNVMLGALPGAGNRLSAWTGVCTGFGLRCTPTNTTGTLTATFTTLNNSVGGISVSNGNSCLLNASGGVECWGSAPLNAGNPVPTSVPGLSSGMVSVASSASTGCALSATGAVQCWGDGQFGVLGTATACCSALPATTIDGLIPGTVQIAVGDTFACALSSGGAVQCWGAAAGLGNGGVADSLTPVQVSGLASGVTAISAGFDHACAITSAGGVQCWGLNGTGQLGNGTTTAASVPVPVAGLASGVAAISAGGWHTCALTTAGGVQCWGYNQWGQVGNGTQGNIFATPQQVTGLTSGIVAVHAGYAHSCAVTTTGGIQCWGNNTSGSLATGNFGSSTVPVAGLLLAGTATLAQGAGDQECLISTSGGALCWGANTQTATGLLTNSANPLAPWVGNISVQATAGGTVTSSAAGINCGTTCAGSFAFGNTITLTATPLAGYTFGGWSGASCSGTGTCAIPITGGTPVSATFNTTLAVAVTGSGTVTSSPAGINCGTNCSANIPAGSTVTLTAVPATGSALASWTGACAGNGTSPTCSVALAAAASVGVSFTTTPTLTVALSASAGGSGSVTSSPAGINCGATCSAAFAYGSSVTLTAVPAAGSTFIGWSDPCGSATTCVVPMSAAGTVTAAFSQPGLNINVSGNGTVTSAPAGTPCTTTGCTLAFAAGTPVTLTAVPSAGSVFAGWSGGGCSGTGTCAVTVQNFTAINASFVDANTAWSLSTNTDHSCMVTAGGAVRCWGGNGNSQLGNNSTANSPLPVQPLGLASGYVAVSAGGGHSCAIHSSGTLNCWGLGTSGQLGALNFSSAAIPISPITAGLVSAVAAGGSHTCVVGTTGAVRCTGANTLGQLGNGGGANSNAFVQVTGLTSGWLAVAAGTSHSCALSTAGAVNCWGDNTYGQLGNGTFVSSPTPVAVSGLASGVRAIAAGAQTSCALLNDGTVRCWGNNTYSQLGIISAGGNFATPQVASGFSQATSVATSGFHTCISTADGNAHCFGLNVFGQIGTGTGSTPPTVAGVAANVVQMSAGLQQSCALLVTGQISCWGLGGSGELGNGATLSSTAPTLVSGLTAGPIPSVPALQTSTVGDGLVTPQLFGADCGAGCFAYPLNQIVPVTATALNGGTFTAWSGACTGIASCSPKVTAPLVLTGNFNRPLLTLTVFGNGFAQALSGALYLNCNGGSLPCVRAFDQGATLTLTASGGTFTGWGGACAGTGPCTLTLTTSVAVTANFTGTPIPNSGVINVGLLGTVGDAFRGGNTIVSNPVGIRCTPSGYSNCGMTLPPNTPVTLTAIAEIGSQFTGWSGGGCSGNSPTCTVASANNDFVNATFIPAPGVNLTVTGSGTITSAPAGLSCTAGGTTGCQLAASAVPLTLTATPGTGATFAGWSGGPCNLSTSPTCVLPASVAGTISATFGKVCLLQSVTGNGSIDSNFGPLPLCDLTGKTINLHAEAANGSVAGTWSGACAGQSGTFCILPWPASSQSLGMTFTAGYTANVIKVGNGAGTVTSSSGGINCGATCSTSSLAYAVPVTLTPAAAAGSVFRGWGGACSGTANCVLDMTQSPLAVSASFFAPLVTTQVGAGGTVQSTPAGIACLGYLSTSDFGTCSATFANAGALSLTATPLNGYSLSSWGGACLGQTTTVCTLSSVSADTVVTVFFTPVGTTGAQTLTTTIVGGGSIVSSSVTLCTSGSCALSVAQGTSLTLTASPAPGFAFSGWSGACSGTASCTALMNAAVAVTATFSPTISVSVSGSGSITSSPAGISCSTSCNSTIPFGTTLTLTATPAAGQVFTGWVGDGCSGTGTCSVSATTPLTVTASFAAAAPTTASGDVPLPPWALAGLALLLSALLAARGAPARGRADHH